MKKNITKVLMASMILFMFSCKNYITVLPRRDCRNKVDEKTLNKYLNVMGIKDIEKEGAILFMCCFENEKYLILNGKDTIYNGDLLTDFSLGTSKSFKYRRGLDIIIYDYKEKKKIRINTKKIKHPFIFVHKDNMTKKYKIKNADFLCYLK